MAATIQKMDIGQKEKDAFLERIGLTKDTYNKLSEEEKQKVQDQWVNSKEFKSLESKEQTPGEFVFIGASRQNNYVTLESFCKLFTAIVIPNTYSSKINRDGSKTKTGKLFEITTKNRGYLEQSNEDLLCLFNN
jgi:hypothetical protein